MVLPWRSPSHNLSSAHSNAALYNATTYVKRRITSYLLIPRAVKRRSALTDMNLKLCERIAKARKGDGLRLHETQDESIGSAKPTCGTNKT
jgi:hypothetical protein